MLSSSLFETGASFLSSTWPYSSKRMFDLVAGLSFKEVKQRLFRPSYLPSRHRLLVFVTVFIQVLLRVLVLEERGYVDTGAVGTCHFNDYLKGLAIMVYLKINKQISQLLQAVPASLGCNPLCDKQLISFHDLELLVTLSNKDALHPREVRDIAGGTELVYVEAH